MKSDYFHHYLLQSPLGLKRISGSPLPLAVLGRALFVGAGSAALIRSRGPAVPVRFSNIEIRCKVPTRRE